MTHSRSNDPDHLHELVSACFDDEVTPQDRAVVEHALVDSPELAARLAEYSELRELLTTSAATTAPVDLCGSVMNLINTPALNLSLPRPPLATTCRTPVRPPGHSARRWSMLAAGVLVIAAVSAWNLRNPQLGQLALHPVADTALPPGPDLAFSDNRASPSPPADPRPEFTAVAESIPAEPSVAEMGIVDDVELRNRLFGSGRTPTPGELLSYLDKIDEQPVIVTYSVLDVVDAMDTVQVLLQREGFHPLIANGPVTTSKGSSGEMQIVAIYLEAPAAQVETVLKEIPVMFQSPEPAASQSQESSSTPNTSRPPGEAALSASTSNAPFQVAVPLDSRSQQQLTQEFSRKENAPILPASERQIGVEANRSSAILILQTGQNK